MHLVAVACRIGEATARGLVPAERHTRGVDRAQFCALPVGAHDTHTHMPFSENAIVAEGVASYIITMSTQPHACRASKAWVPQGKAFL